MNTRDIPEGEITLSMTTKNTKLATLKLPAQTGFYDGQYTAQIERLNLTGQGNSIEDAQNDLIDKFIAWIQVSDVQENLEIALKEAGFSNVAKNTKLELEFIL